MNQAKDRRNCRVVSGPAVLSGTGMTSARPFTAQ